MRPQYIQVAAGVPKVVPLDTNKIDFNVTIDPKGATVEQTISQVFDPILLAAASWGPAPAAVGGLINLTAGVTAIRLSSAGAVTAIVLQNGIQ
jgi:hypothetical protein